MFLSFPLQLERIVDFERDNLVRCRVFKLDVSGVEVKSVRTCYIQVVADNGMAQTEVVRGVNTQLVRATGQREEMYPCVALLKGDDFKFRVRRFPTLVTHDWSGTVVKIDPERKVDKPFMLMQLAFQ